MIDIHKVRIEAPPIEPFNEAPIFPTVLAGKQKPAAQRDKASAGVSR